jgi:hypothetical protein
LQSTEALTRLEYCKRDGGSSYPLACPAARRILPAAAGRALPSKEYKAMKFTGKLLDGDRVILVEGDLVLNVGGPVRWFGYFTVLPNFLFDPHKKYRMEFDDGRSGDVYIHSHEKFTGVGSLQ